MFRTVHSCFLLLEKIANMYIVIILLCMTICLKLENHEAGELQIRPDSLSFQRWVSWGPDWSKGDLQASPVAKRHKCQRYILVHLGWNLMHLPWFTKYSLWVPITAWPLWLLSEFVAAHRYAPGGCRLPSATRDLQGRNTSKEHLAQRGCWRNENEWNCFKIAKR